jgi:hypothetical protein
MSRRRKQYGKCKLCGFDGKLSFEHVPPSKAFNNDDYYYYEKCSELIQIELDENFNYPDNVKKRYRKKAQGGVGFYSLCERCNNNTGSWYGSDFISWIYQSMGILLKTNHRPTLYYPTYFYPLRVIKQILCMFFSINSDNLNEREPELVKFLLDKERKYLNPRYKVFCYYNIMGKPRYLGDMYLGDFQTGEIIHMSELTFPPMGFVLTLNSNKPNIDLEDISGFSNYGYNDRLEYFQRFKVLPTHLSFIPADYRSKNEIIEGIRYSNLPK